MDKIIHISALSDGEYHTIYALTNKGNLWRGCPKQFEYGWKWEEIEIPEHLFPLDEEEE